MGQDHDRLKLYLAHRSALVDYATPLTGNRAQAEDVVQEAYFRFVPQREGGAATADNPLAYLYRIVRNLALDLIRRNGAESRREAQIALMDAGLTMPGLDEVFVHREELRRAAAALAELPDRTRLAFELHRFHEQTFHQIADRLGISITTAHRLVRDAVVHVTRRLAADES